MAASREAVFAFESTVYLFTGILGRLTCIEMCIVRKSQGGLRLHVVMRGTAMVSWARVVDEVVPQGVDELTIADPNVPQ